MSTSSFRYRAIDAHGKTVRGVIRAATESDAFRKLASSGQTPIELTIETNERSPLSPEKITRTDIADFTRELCVLVQARIPLDRGLLSIADHEGKPALTAMIRDIAAKVQAGSPMTSALKDYREQFGEVYIETMKAAEKSGNLAAVMSHLADMLEKQMETRQALKRAFAYPLILLIVVSMALSVIVIFVVPKFSAIFQDKEISLPLATRVVHAVGASARAYWWAYLAATAAIIGGLWSTWKTPDGRVLIERGLLRLPYIRKVIIAMTAGRFARVLSIGLASGLDIIDSIEIGGRSTGQAAFTEECSRMATQLRTGQALQDVLVDSKYVPQFAKRMLSAGKDANELSKACEVVSRYYERDAAHLLKNINTIIEPVITVVMAGVVLLVALSVFLPMWQITQVRH